MSRRALLLLPLAFFLCIGALLAVPVLQERDPKIIPSAMIGKPAPATGNLKFDRRAVVNFFATWCAPCAAEQPVLQKIAAAGIPVYGVVYKDTAADTAGWLEKHGNPFAQTVRDDDGRLAIEWGVYGVPETFVVDEKGVIVFRHVGPLSYPLLEHTLMPVLKGEKP